MVYGWCLIRWQFGVLLVLLLLAALFYCSLLDILIKSNGLIALATDLGNSDCDETAKGHTNKVSKRTREDTDEDRDENGEEGTSEKHVHAVVVAVMAVMVGVVRTTIVLHVVRWAVVSARAEPVGWLAPESILGHRAVVAVRARHAVRAVVAAWSSLTHVLPALKAIGHDTLPLAKKWPLLALLLLLYWRSLDLFCVKRCYHETAGRFLEQIDRERGRVHSHRFDRGNLDSHGKQLDSRL